RTALRTLALPQHSACHWPPPKGGPSHQAIRHGWLKIAAAPVGQPGSGTGLFPASPRINANASPGAVTARMVIRRPVVILVMVSSQSVESRTRINEREQDFLEALTEGFQIPDSKDSRFQGFQIPEGIL